jgi:hypothetical protein
VLPEKYKRTMPPSSITGVVKPGKQQTEMIGTMSCLFGQEPFEIKVAAKEIKGGELFRLRKLELRPAAR